MERPALYKWKIYDDLIEGIPAHLIVEECMVGMYWTYVVADGNAGIAMTINAGNQDGFAHGSFLERPLKEVAAYAKSWNMIEASIGMAAINAYYNTPAQMEASGVDLGMDIDDPGRSAGTGKNIFNESLEFLRGKKVTVIGHFPNIEEKLGNICTLSVLERKPLEGDYLDSACEYILSEQDVVFMTGVTFTNKTLPRLLELTTTARTILVGPSAPMTPILFKYGIDSIAGFYVTDINKTRELVSQAAYFGIFRGGKRTVIK